MKLQARGGSRHLGARRGTGALWLVGALLAILLAGWSLGLGPGQLPGNGGRGGASTGTAPLSGQEEAAADFVSAVFDDTEAIWRRVFESQVGQPYDPPALVLFSGATPSPRDNDSDVSGPFYCPTDRTVYLDTAFFAELRDRLGERGDFATSFVVAHEVAHHVQNELGILGEADELRAGQGGAGKDSVTVRVELQADCFSGIWAHGADLGSPGPGDLVGALGAAIQICDDKLTKNAGPVPQPHATSHGSSEQRQRWFAIGYESGELAACDTLAADPL